MYNPFTRSATARPVMTRTFTDHETEQEIHLTFRQLRGGEAQNAFDDGEKLITLYLKGSDDMPAVDFPRIPLPRGESQPVIREDQFIQAASLAAMQPPTAKERYSAEYFIAMSYVLPPEVWMEIRQFSVEVDRATNPKNAERQVTNGNCEPALKTTEDTTNLTSGKTPSSATSPEELEHSVSKVGQEILETSSVR